MAFHETWSYTRLHDRGSLPLLSSTPMFRHVSNPYRRFHLNPSPDGVKRSPMDCLCIIVVVLTCSHSFMLFYCCVCYCCWSNWGGLCFECDSPYTELVSCFVFLVFLSSLWRRWSGAGWSIIFSVQSLAGLSVALLSKQFENCVENSFSWLGYICISPIVCNPLWRLKLTLLFLCPYFWWWSYWAKYYFIYTLCMAHSVVCSWF